MIYIRFFIVSAMLCLIGCSGIRVSQDYDPASDSGVLTSFAWASETQQKTGDSRLDNPLRDARTRAAVELLLHEKGIDKKSAGTPAFFVRYTYGLRQKIESSGTRGGIGFGLGSFGRHGGIALGTGDSVEEIDEESLTIDFLGQDLETLFWRGTGVQRFMEYDDPEKTTRSIQALVTEILDQFPPK
ncbi:DUF4136 domain-containing protein [Desulfoluna sp.]|uniref:DUF4136 domain-containing protein n=1 Tax=Desulfoluna sp. TaxID=2045199 RepID=UPI0026237B66|nr:DUF4136 domain-containing protein [Desulfoluna sp.]